MTCYCLFLLRPNGSLQYTYGQPGWSFKTDLEQQQGKAQDIVYIPERGVVSPKPAGQSRFV